MKHDGIEKQIEAEYYNSAWFYMTHAGYDKERDEKNFAAYRLRRLKELTEAGVMA